MPKWIDAKVVEKKQWNYRLFSLRLEADFPEFEAGQFTRLAMDVDGEEISRPFSLVNAPHESILDFYFIEVLDGALSPKLAQLEPGDKIQVAAKASGLLTLKQLQSGKTLFLLSTGTGIGPFLSIIKTEQPWQQFEKVVLVHAVREQSELTYQDTIEQVKAQHPDRFSYVPIVSREQCDYALDGRIPKAIADGRLEQKAGATFNPEDTQVMLCGNPAMVQDTMALLINERGLTRHSRREPGNISIEKYW